MVVVVETWVPDVGLVQLRSLGQEDVLNLWRAVALVDLDAAAPECDPGAFGVGDADWSAETLRDVLEVHLLVRMAVVSPAPPMFDEGEVPEWLPGPLVRVDETWTVEALVRLDERVLEMAGMTAEEAA